MHTKPTRRPASRRIPRRNHFEIERDLCGVGEFNPLCISPNLGGEGCVGCISPKLGGDFLVVSLPKIGGGQGWVEEFPWRSSIRFAPKALLFQHIRQELGNDSMTEYPRMSIQRVYPQLFGIISA